MNVFCSRIKAQFLETWYPGIISTLSYLVSQLKCSGVGGREVVRRSAVT